MSLFRTGHVIAGADDSEQAARAVEFAAREAELRGVTLEIIRAVQVPSPMLLPDGAAWPMPGSIVASRGHLSRIVAEVREGHSGLPVAGAVLLGRASDVLVDLSVVGQLLVVGSRGSPTVERLLVGSVSLAVAAHAHCPVAVVTEQTAEIQRVVVGTDGSAEAFAAVEVGFESAANRGVPLEVVSAVDPALYGGAWFWTMVPPTNDVRQSAAEALRSEIAPLRRRFPKVEVGVEAVKARPAVALLERSSVDTLLVIGSRGRGSIGGTLLGSVGQNVLHHTDGPTIIVHLPKGRAVERAEFGSPRESGSSA